MNRSDFLKSLGIGMTTLVTAPVVIAKVMQEKRQAKYIEWDAKKSQLTIHGNIDSGTTSIAGWEISRGDKPTVGIKMDNNGSFRIGEL